MLACRLTSASLVFSAGNVAAPQPTKETADKIRKALPRDGLDHASDLESSRWERTPLLQSQREFTPEEESEQCRLYYYYFSLTTGKITHQYGLSAIPFEFPTLNPTKEMSTARYIYGCSTSASSFGAALGRAVKIDVIAKIDALALIEKARIGRPTEVTGCVDRRSVAEVLSDNEFNVQDPVRCFKMPEGWYAQEARFVARDSTQSEDDGFLLFYAFDEAQMDEDGECPDNAVSQLWVLDAKGMRDVICKVTLPQRVPYGLHGGWFSEEQIAEQREVEIFRKIPALKTKEQRNTWDRIREAMIGMLG